jgi:hypothetical protein
LRLYTRGIIIRVLGASDWSILLALVGLGSSGGCSSRARLTVLDIRGSYMRGSNRTFV